MEAVRWVGSVLMVESKRHGGKGYSESLEAMELV